MKISLLHKIISTSSGLKLAIVLSLMFFGNLRDFIYAQLSNTGFYWSESFAFQNFWLWFLPIFLFYSFVINDQRFPSKNWYLSSLLIIGTTFLQLILHIAVVMVYARLLNYSYHILTVFSSSIHEFAVLGFLANFALFFYHNKSGAESENAAGFVKGLHIRSGTKQFVLSVDEIIFLQKDENYVKVKTVDSLYLISETLKELSTKLDDKIFVRIHRSYIVNRAFVQCTRSRKNGDYDIVLTTDEELRLSRRYRKNFFTD